ncbi:MAG: family 16 glycoside hydrolase [Planctomycetota bacterium]
MLSTANTVTGAQPLTLHEALAEAPAYEFGQSRLALTVIGDAVSDAVADPTRRPEMERGILGLLENPNASPESRDFACRQLARIGSSASVPILADMLRNGRESPLARYALQSIPGGAASAALRDALDDLEGELLVGVINSIAERRDAQALDALKPLAGSADDAVAFASIAALGRLGTPAASDVLLGLTSGDLEGEKWDAVADALLVCADELQPREPHRAARLYWVVLTRAKTENQLMAAVRGRVECEGPAGVPMVVELLGREDETLQGFALELVRSVRHPGATQAFVEAMKGLRPEPEALLISALGDRGDVAALPAILGALETRSTTVRRAALRAIGTLGNGSAVTGLARIAASSDEQDAALARESLRRLRSDDADAGIARAIAMARPDVRVELIGALGDRGAFAHAEAVIATARDGNADVRLASFRALEQIGRPQDLRHVVDLLLSVETEPDRRAAEKAVIGTCLRTDDVDGRSRPVADAMDDADVDGQRSLLVVMSRIGGDRALAAAREALGDAALHNAAVVALAGWTDDAAAPDLLRLASSARGAATGKVALRGYIRLAGRAEARPPEVTAQMYGRALDLSAETEDRRLILEGLSGVGELEALRLAQTLLDDTAVAETAASTVLVIAGRLGERDRAEALEAIREVLRKHGGDDLRRQAGAAASRLEAGEDFITAWLIAGPFSSKGAGPQELFDLEFAPESGTRSEAVAWARLTITRPKNRGIFDLDKAVGGGNRCAYVKTWLWSDRERRIGLELGSDDGIKAWINGNLVHANNALRGITVGGDRAEADLLQGKNTLLLKITQGGGQWSFSCRVRDPLGFHADGVRFADDRELTIPPAGASILLDGATARQWTDTGGNPVRWTVENGALVVRPGTGSIRTRDEYRDFILHAEFLVPGGVSGSGQFRGNSGVYLQGRYEVQILDSWGGDPMANGCGAIYGHKAPRLVASRPPGQWQSYLIDFTAPRYDGDERKVRNARVTVWHNGLLVHDDVEIPDKTGRGAPEASAPGPIILQDHGDRIRFRNVWVVPRPPTWEGVGASGFAPLFDGRTLEGWRQLGGGAEYRVESGEIVGSTRPNQPNSFLCTERLFDDFVLELEFRVHPELNSGIQIRSNSTPQYRNGQVHGYQVEIDPSDRAWTAGIYDEGRRGWLAPLDEDAAAGSVFQQGGWNRLRVVAHGDTIRTWLNGVPVAHLVDSMTPAGFIGLQVHGVGDREDPLEVRWRDIRIKGIKGTDLFSEPSENKSVPF